MARTPSTMLDLNTVAPDFSLLDPASGRFTSLNDFPDKQGYVILFISNHCPFVQHIRHELARFGHEYIAKGMAVIAINSNDVQAYPADSPEKMIEETQHFDYDFPYLFDEEQTTAKAYAAACTPDFYLFDANKKLVYRGQFDSSRPDNDLPVTGADLRAATNSLLQGHPLSSVQKPSIGCSIKWKPGNEPNYQA